MNRPYMTRPHVRAPTGPRPAPPRWLQDPATEVSVSGFYDIYRPLLGAFWPDGVTLEGAGPDPDGAAVVRAKGPSAGQSTMFMLFDVMLDVPVSWHPFAIILPLYFCNVFLSLFLSRRVFAPSAPILIPEHRQRVRARTAHTATPCITMLTALSRVGCSVCLIALSA